MYTVKIKFLLWEGRRDDVWPSVFFNGETLTQMSRRPIIWQIQPIPVISLHATNAKYLSTLTTVTYSLSPCYTPSNPGIRSMLRDMLAEFSSRGLEGTMVAKQAYIDKLKSLPIAIDTNAANIQHYEVPTSFYKLVLGPYMKYSCGLWPSSNTSFQDSETEMLELYCQRAELEDGMKILDLGCGWGSVSLFVAKKYPRSQIFSLSNSATQREYIENEAQKRGLTNITVWTADINGFEIPRTTGAGGGGGGAGGLLKALMKKASLSRVAAEEPGEEVLGASSPTTPYTPVTTASADTTKGAAASSSATDADLFDRVISIEMFEHMKNYQKLLAKVSSWLRPGGKLFVHIFTHATTAYHFDESWMAENFFTGGRCRGREGVSEGGWRR